MNPKQYFPRQCALICHFGASLALLWLGACSQSVNPLSSDGRATGSFQLADAPRPPLNLTEANDNNQVFAKYRRGGNSQLASNWTRGIDLSGVAMDSHRTATLIAPNMVVMAKHFQRQVGDTLVFHDANGRRVARKLSKKRNTRFDIAIGLLESPVPPQITHYPVPIAIDQPTELVRLNHKLALVTDRDRRVFVHRIENVIGGSYLRLEHSATEKKRGLVKHLIGGDSGNPTFLPQGNSLILIQTQTHGGPGAGPFFGSTAVQKAIIKAAKELDPDFALTRKSIL